jgi:hypothetical protein
LLKWRLGREVTLSFLHPRFLFAAVVIATVPVALASACSGSEFSAADADAGMSGGSGGAGGGAGATAGGSQNQSGTGGSSTGVKCQGPEDCNDQDPCTVDSCGSLGECQVTPKCEEPLRCCDGDCGQCCSNDDCADDLECTNDICFAGSCTHVPNNNACAENEYCSAIAGCKELEPCTGEIDGECEDGDPCTTDRCINLLCEHLGCDDDQLCCPGVGCGSCCADSQCKDDDPCTSDTCSEGRCENGPLCASSGSAGGDVQCCVGLDGASASCGTCCSAAECNDGVSCTVDACERGACTHTPGPCGAGMVCDPIRNCVPAVQCQNDSQCNDNIACTRDSCVQGSCVNTPDNSLCGTGTCSVQLGRCLECTGNFQCNDNNGCTTDTCDLTTYTCKYTPGACGNQLCCGNRCQQCCTAYDCEAKAGTAGGSAKPEAAPIFDGGVGGLCSWWACDNGTCVQQSTYCDFGTCCPGYGCTLNACPI